MALAHILVFGVIIGVTMFVTFLAAKRVKSAADFYTAGGGVSGLQNGWAIAGDYLSRGFVSRHCRTDLALWLRWIHVLGRMAGRLHHGIVRHRRALPQHRQIHAVGHSRLPERSHATRIVGALSVITVSTFYLTAQMVGGGVLVKTLIGIDYEVSVIVVGVLMLGYVLFGGMVATTWVQIIKAILLVTRIAPARDVRVDTVRLQLPLVPQRRRRRCQGAGTSRPLLGDASRTMRPSNSASASSSPASISRRR